MLKFSLEFGLKPNSSAETEFKTKVKTDLGLNFKPKLI